MSKNRFSHRHIIISLKLFVQEMYYLVTSPVFFVLTLMGNLIIVLFSLLFYLIEHSMNPKLITLIDALWWGFSTATTTGAGDIFPLTNAGKIIGILLMLVGTAIFAMFTALFAETIILSSKRSSE